MLPKEYLDPEVVLWDDVESHMNPCALTLLATWLTELSEKGKHANKLIIDNKIAIAIEEMGRQQQP